MATAETSVAIASVEVGLGAVCNLLLIFALAHTWKHWRQVKWYVILLTVGNVLEVGFTVGLYLGWLETETWSSSRHACKFLVFMSTLGPNLANMALAALALHVLLTSITGNQGNRLRHALVLGLFVLLSLPLPLTQIPMYDVQSFHTSGGYTSVCGNFLLTTDEQRLYYHIGFNVSIVFFPLFVFLVAFVATLILNFKGGSDNKTDVSSSDLILGGILALVMAICCVPASSADLYASANPYRYSPSLMRALRALMFLRFARPILAAAVCVVFGYVHAFRNRDQGYAPMEGGQRGSGERQKLVN